MQIQVRKFYKIPFAINSIKKALYNTESCKKSIAVLQSKSS